MKSTLKLGRPRLLIVGCGDVGRRCIARLHDRFRLFAMTRDTTRVAQWRQAQAVGVRADLDARRSLRRIAGLAPYILHLAPPPGEGNDDPRTRALLAALGAAGASMRRPCAVLTGGLRRQGRTLARHAAIVPEGRLRPVHGAGPRGVSRARGRRAAAVHARPVVVYASTSGVYGDCGGALINETRTPRPANPRARRRMAAEARLRAAGRDGTVAPRIIRIPGIYAAERLPLARLQAGTAALREDEDVYTSHIHADDLAAILVRALWRGRTQRIVHAVDATRLKMGAYFDLVADTYGLPRPPRIARAQAEATLPPTLLSFMRESRQLDNTRLVRELRVRLRYPDVTAFLAGQGPVAQGANTPEK